MHDLVNDRLLDVDFKMENQRETFSSYFAVLLPKEKKKNTVQVRKKLSDWCVDALKLKQCQNWFAKFQ